MSLARVGFILLILAPLAQSFAVNLQCFPLFGRARNFFVKPATARDQMQKAWAQNFSDPVVKEFWTVLTDKTYSHRISAKPYNGSVEPLDQVFEQLDEKIRKATFLRLSTLLLTYELLPGDHESVFSAHEVKDLIMVLQHRSKDLDLSVLEVKALLTLILDRWKAAQNLDANYKLAEAIEGRSLREVPKWLRSKAWGKQEIRLKDVHDTPNLKVATAKTFNFHMKSQPLTHEAIKESFAKTLSGSKLDGAEFTAIVKSLVLNPAFYMERTYYTGTSGLVAELQAFAGTLREAAKHVALSDQDLDQTQILLRRFALGLLLTRNFAEQQRPASPLPAVMQTVSDYLRGFTLHVRTESEMNEYRESLAPIKDKKSPELPADLDRALETQFASGWGQ